MNEQERQELAEKLAGMKYREARRWIRLNLDDANLKFFRNDVNREVHTQYEVPSERIRIILVEAIQRQPIPNVPEDKRVKVDYLYTEARVVEWEPPATGA